MGPWKEYAFGIVTVSLCCSIILQIIPDSEKKELLRIVTGVLLVVTILQPISKCTPDDFLIVQKLMPETAEPFLAVGKQTAETMKKQYITGRCEAYILDKAKAMGVEIKPRIAVDNSGLPYFAEIHGEIEPEIQEKLEQLLISDMGITKENQRWIWNPESGS